MKTNSKGTATSKQLYLSKYRVVETVAPYGTVINPEPHTVELTYSGQNEKLTNLNFIYKRPWTVISNSGNVAANGGSSNITTSTASKTRTWTWNGVNGSGGTETRLELLLLVKLSGDGSFLPVIVTRYVHASQIFKVQLSFY